MLQLLSDLYQQEPSYGICLSQREHVDTISLLSEDCFDIGWSEIQLLNLLNESGGFVWHAAGKKKPDHILSYVIIRAVSDEAEILSIGTAKQHQGKGIARKLLQTAIATLKAQHINHLFLEVSTENISANHLYNKLGFEKVGIRKSYYKHAHDNSYQDASVLKLDLKTYANQ